jgi:hypothetical protein
MSELEKLLREAEGGKGRRPGRLVEFEGGQHSESQLFAVPSRECSDGLYVLDDTCVQPGYWEAVAGFIASC